MLAEKNYAKKELCFLTENQYHYHQPRKQSTLILFVLSLEYFRLFVSIYTELAEKIGKAFYSLYWAWLEDWSDANVQKQYFLWHKTYWSLIEMKLRIELQGARRNKKKSDDISYLHAKSSFFLRLLWKISAMSSRKKMTKNFLTAKYSN